MRLSSADRRQGFQFGLLEQASFFRRACFGREEQRLDFHLPHELFLEHHTGLFHLEGFFLPVHVPLPQGGVLTREEGRMPRSSDLHLLLVVFPAAQLSKLLLAHGQAVLHDFVVDLLDIVGPRPGDFFVLEGGEQPGLHVHDVGRDGVSRRCAGAVLGRRCPVRLSTPAQ